MVSFLDIKIPKPCDTEGISDYVMEAFLTNKDQQSKPHLIEDIIPYLVSIAVCYRH